MDLTGEHRIAAPRETVWDALNDDTVLRDCIPGCAELVKNSETEFSAIVVQKIGPVKAKFTGNVELTNINAPASYTIQGEGSGGVAGFAKGGPTSRSKKMAAKPFFVTKCMPPWAESLHGLGAG